MLHSSPLSDSLFRASYLQKLIGTKVAALGNITHKAFVLRSSTFEDTITPPPQHVLLSTQEIARSGAVCFLFAGGKIAVPQQREA